MSTAALFGRIPEHEYQNQHPQGQQQQQSEKPWDQHSEQTVDIPHEEKKKKWYEIDDHRKKQLEVSFSPDQLSSTISCARSVEASLPELLSWVGVSTLGMNMKRTKKR